eukprot:scaffold8455_cov71-Skeletonema_dohrnii-CCMP3373.AAC.1
MVLSARRRQSQTINKSGSLNSCITQSTQILSQFQLNNRNLENHLRKLYWAWIGQERQQCSKYRNCSCASKDLDDGMNCNIFVYVEAFFKDD